MKKSLLVCLFALCANILPAQHQFSKFEMYTRADYQRESIDDKVNDDNSGFKGKYLMLRMDGNLGDGFTYSYRQRFNKGVKDATFFDATDWLALTYTTGNWSFSGGKQVVAIGGYEYDLNPIDVYFASEFWNNIGCFQFGASVSYKFNDGKDSFTAQVSQSPFSATTKNIYAYNFMWCGSHGMLSTIYSTNLVEYLPGKYIGYISLGNRFTAEKISLELDVMNRASNNHAFFGKNMSIIGNFTWNATEQLNVCAKATYDVNNTDCASDMCVLPGTEITRVGAGVEFFPMPNGRKDVRLHAIACYTFGNNSNTAGTAIDKQAIISAGVTWNIDLLNLRSKK